MVLVRNGFGTKWPVTVGIYGVMYVIRDNILGALHLTIYEVPTKFQTQSSHDHCFKMAEVKSFEYSALLN